MIKSELNFYILLYAAYYLNDPNNQFNVRLDRRGHKSHTQEIFLSNGKRVYYQDVPQLPVPLNTLHTVHLKAKSHDLI